MTVARSTAWRNRSASAALSKAARPIREKISRPTSAPARLASTTAGTNTLAWTVPLAMAMPPMISRMSPGAKGTGTPISSMKANAQMTPARRSPSRSSKTSTGLSDIRLRRTLNQLRDQRDGEVAALEEPVVERLGGESWLLLGLAAHLVDQQLAQRVVQVQGVEGAPDGLSPRREFALKALLHEGVDGVLHGHAPAMQPDGDQETAIPQQGIHQLSELEARVVLVPGLQHHLFAIVGPALPGALDPKEPAGRGGCQAFVQGLDVMPRVGFVDRDIFQDRVVEVAEPLLGLGGSPVWGGDGHVVVALGCRRLQRARTVQGRAGPGHEAGRGRHHAAHVGRDGHQAAV